MNIVECEYLSLSVTNPETHFWSQIFFTKFSNDSPQFKILMTTPS